jgi:hypothetical protein
VDLSALDAVHLPALDPLKTWEDVGGGATTLGVLVAVLAVGFTYLQYLGSKKIETEATAKQIYSKYLELAIKYPILASEPPGPDSTKEEIERHKWFVAYMLRAFEQILVSQPLDEVWRICVHAQMNYHQKYICSKQFTEDELHFYSDEVRLLVGKVCRGEPP